MKNTATIISRMGVLALFVAYYSASAHANGQLFIPLGSSDSIQIVDPGTNKVTGRIDGVSAVHGLAITPDGNLLVAGSFDERVPGTAMLTRPEGVSADDHAAHHSPKDTASDATADPVVSTLTILDARSGKVRRHIDVPGGVHHVATSPDNRYAALTHPSEDLVTLVDLEGFQVVATVKTGSMPNYAVFSPDGKSVYVSDSSDGRISEIKTQGWSVTRRLEVGESPEHVVMTADGTRFYTNNVGDGTVSEVDLENWHVTRRFTTGSTPHGIDLSADGRFLMVSVMDEHKLMRIDLLSGEKKTLQLDQAPYHLATHRGGGRVFVSSADSPKLWVVNPDTLTAESEIAIAGKGHQMAQGGAN